MAYAVIADAATLQETCDTWAHKGWGLASSAVTGASTNRRATAGRILGQSLEIPVEFTNQVRCPLERDPAEA
jgi:hypothetical protein